MSTPIRVALDAMGGDHGCAVAVEGAARARRRAVPLHFFELEQRRQQLHQLPGVRGVLLSVALWCHRLTGPVQLQEPLDQQVDRVPRGRSVATHPSPKPPRMPFRRPSART